MNEGSNLIGEGAAPPAPVHLAFRWTEHEFRVTFARAIRQNRCMWLSAGVIALMIFISPGPDLGALLIGAAVGLVFWFGMAAVSARAVWRKNPHMREHQVLEFSDDGLAHRSESTQSQVTWSFFRRADERRFRELLSGKLPAKLR